MKSLRTIGSARRLVGAWRAAGERIALVPTMGNLHAGHESLMHLARRHADRVVASIFVNPTQFGPQEDYHSYPRTPAADRALLRRAGVDAVFAPSVAVMYTRGDESETVVSVPGLSQDLCGAFRPGHFDGVASVVLRLVNILAPDAAIFGEKDYQQLVLLRRMLADLHVPVTVIGGPTVREPDGLAMSSRNRYLTAAERQTAPGLHAALEDCARQLRSGHRDLRVVERRALARLRHAGFRPDYVAIRRAGDLQQPAARDRDLRILAAAWLGRARLIDNIPARRR